MEIPPDLHYTVQKMKFFIKDFFSKLSNPQESADLVTFIEEILNRTVDFFVQCYFSVYSF